MKRFLIALALFLLPSVAWAQCNGIFPSNTLCGNLSGSPQPPAAFTASGTVVGPGSSTTNDIATYANSAGTQIKDSGILITSVLTGVRSAYTSTNSLATTDCGKSVALGGSAYYTFTVNAASGYAAACPVSITDEDNTCPSNGASTCRGKLIAINGYPSFILWPGQTFLLINQNNTWQFNQPGRWQLPVNMTWYVNHASGVNPSDCLQPGAAACATYQQAILQVQQSVDCNPQVNLTLQNANETFTEGSAVYFGSKPCYHEVFLTGNPSTPANVVWTVPANQVGITTRDYGIVTLNGFKFTSGAATGATAFSATQMGVIDFQNIEFGAFPGGTHLSCVNNAGINWIGGTYVVSGNMTTHVTANGPCMITIAGATISVPNALTFTNWAQSQSVGVLNFSSDTFTGTGAAGGSTGTKYNVSLNSVLVLSGTVLPGATGGAVGSGGQVQ